MRSDRTSSMLGHTRGPGAHSGGDASRTWAPGSTAAEVDARLRGSRKIGPKKASVAVDLLVTHFGIDLAELHGTNVAYDVRRVFLRTGLVDREDIRDISRAGSVPVP